MYIRMIKNNTKYAQYASARSYGNPPYPPRSPYPTNNPSNERYYSKDELISNIQGILTQFSDECNLIYETIERIDTLLDTINTKVNKTIVNELITIKDNLSMQLLGLVSLHKQMYNELSNLTNVTITDSYEIEVELTNENIVESEYRRIQQLIDKCNSRIRNSNSLSQKKNVDELEKQAMLADLEDRFNKIVEGFEPKLRDNIRLSTEIKIIKDTIFSLKINKTIEKFTLDRLNSQIESCQNLYSEMQTKINECRKRLEAVDKKYKAFSSKYLKLLSISQESKIRGKTDLSVDLIKTIDSYSDAVYDSYLRAKIQTESATYGFEISVMAVEQQCNDLCDKYEANIEDLTALFEMANKKIEEPTIDIATEEKKEPIPIVETKAPSMNVEMPSKTIDNENENYKAQIITMLGLFTRYGVLDKEEYDFFFKNKSESNHSLFTLEQNDRELLNRLFSSIMNTPPEKITIEDYDRTKKLLPSLIPHGLDKQSKEAINGRFEEYINELTERKTHSK